MVSLSNGTLYVDPTVNIAYASVNDPQVDGLSGAIGSMYINDLGHTWQKVGVGDFDWVTVTESSTTSFTAGEFIPVRSVVYIATDGLGYVAKHDDLDSLGKVIGISMSGAALGDEVIATSSGTYTDNAWSFTVNEDVYFDNTGQLTNVKPLYGYSQVMGYSTASNQVRLSIKNAEAPNALEQVSIHINFLDFALVDGQNPWFNMQGKDYIYHGSDARIKRAILTCGSPDTSITHGSMTINGVVCTAPNAGNTPIITNFPEVLSSDITDGTVINFTWNEGGNADLENLEVVLVAEYNKFVS